MGCIFCEIAKNPDKEVFITGKYFYVKFDKNPVSDKHCLIVLKRHTTSIDELNKEEWCDLGDTVKKVINQLGLSDYNLGINEGIAAGRTIDHLHIHIIPRILGDVENPIGGVRNVIPEKGNYLK